MKTQLHLLLILFFVSNFALAQSDSTIQKYDEAALERLDKLSTDMFYQSISFADSITLQKYIALTPSELPPVNDSIFKSRLDLIPAVIPMDYNGHVKAFINFFTVRKRDYSTRMLGNSQVYFPIFEEILDRKGLPDELKYLAIIESAFNPNAVSRVGATGIWQIMHGTGKVLGLEINSYVDERRDPRIATEAATDYLKKLYNIYDDWLLAIAAYNSGPGNVNKAIRRSGGYKNFWAIRDYLPRETRSYVPIFIAAAYMMNYPEEHKLVAAQPIINPFVVDTVLVKKRVSLKFIANNLDVEEGFLRYLNPALKVGVVPANKTGYPLNLPLEYAGLFAEKEKIILNDTTINEEEIKKAIQPARTVYRVRRGDNLGAIASRYRVGVSQLKRWNGLRSSRIYVGQRLIIYPRGSSRAVANSSSKSKTNSSSKSKTSSTSKKYHTVRRGETLGVLAQRYGCSISQLRSWNGISGNTIKVGQRLVVSRSVSKSSNSSGSGNKTYYTVKNGDTLGEIAESYGVTAQQIRNWNGISGSRIKVGQRLKIYPKKTTTIARNSVTYHTIKSGDTLWDISRKYGVSVSKIKKDNNIGSSYRLKPGQVLKINK